MFTKTPKLPPRHLANGMHAMNHAVKRSKDVPIRLCTTIDGKRPLLARAISAKPPTTVRGCKVRKPGTLSRKPLKIVARKNKEREYAAYNPTGRRTYRSHGLYPRADARHDPKSGSQQHTPYQWITTNAVYHESEYSRWLEECVTALDRVPQPWGMLSDRWRFQKRGRPKQGGGF